MAKGARDDDSDDEANMTKADYLNKRKDKMLEKMSKRDHAI